MSTVIYKARWRPVRVGWCVCNGDFDSLIKALRLTHCLWGGRFNPIIVIDNEALARRMIELFHVDVLWPVSRNESCKAFAKSIKHLPSPFIHDELFRERGASKECILLDITHPIRIFFEANVKDKATPRRSATFYRWVDGDPLAVSFEATFGRYPEGVESGVDYQTFAMRNTAGKDTEIVTAQPVEGAAVRAISANRLTSLQLSPELGAERYDYRYGLFVGDADSFLHLVEFWNLRAAGIELFFLDLRFADRLELLIDELQQIVRSLPPHPILGSQRLGIWLARKIDRENDLKRLTVPLLTRDVNEYTWDDRVWKGLKVTPPVMHFPEYSSVAQISDDDPRPTVTLELRDKPGFDEEPFRGQWAVVTVRPILNYWRDERFLLTVPFIPELNEYFGRQHYFDWDKARAEKDGLGIITHLWTEHITLFGMERFSFARQLFESFGIAAEVSQPGLICDQLIRQMGGIQGCRVFKIKGVRSLIEQFGPTQAFTRSDAIRLIGAVDPATGQPNFDAYENLYLEARGKTRLKPADAFSYLLKRRVFRVGLKFECPNCKLKFWRSLDDARTLLICEYCGKEFNATPQLKDRDWAYRPSGLFGRGDNQEGGVPVALTLQQLETTLRGNSVLWLPALELKPLSVAIEKCETDFVVLCQDWHGRVQLVMGECKANGEVTADDVRKLSKAADAFPADRFDVFLVFSKTSQFSQEEIERCRAVDSSAGRRGILLSERELEPYFVYERAAKEFAVNETAISLDDMVEATRAIYFEPRSKSVKTDGNLLPLDGVPTRN